jgi:hypothetical protein
MILRSLCSTCRESSTVVAATHHNIVVHPAVFTVARTDNALDRKHAATVRRLSGLSFGFFMILAVVCDMSVAAPEPVMIFADAF